MKINYIETLHIQSNIPKNWIKMLKQKTYTTPLGKIQIASLLMNLREK